MMFIWFKGYGGNLVENYYKSIPANTPLRQGVATGLAQQAVVPGLAQQAVGVLNPSFF